MHKPVRVLRPIPVDLKPLMGANLRAALSAALLLLPARFNEHELFGTVCGLSYSGDVRMGLGENHDKPGNIASGQRGALSTLYERLLAGQSLTLIPGDAGTDVPWRQQLVCLPARRELLVSLPSNVQVSLLSTLGRQTEAFGDNGASMRTDVTDKVGDALALLWRESANDEEANARLSTALRHSLDRIVRRASMVQTAKGILTAGLSTSFTYALRKMRSARGVR